MALRGALVSRDKWRLCILNGFGALATWTRSPRVGWSASPDLSSLGSAPTEQSENSDCQTFKDELLKKNLAKFAKHEKKT